MSFLRGTEEYYQKFIELQEKLRKSEEERLVLEMKFNEMVQVTREEEQTYYRKLRNQYKHFLEEDRRRQERNERIMRVLERIESRAGMLAAKTERFELLRQQYLAYLKRIFSNTGQDRGPPQIPGEIPTIIEEKADLYDHPVIRKAMYGDRLDNISQHTDLYEHPVVKKALFGGKDDKSLSSKLDVVNQYLRSLSTPISGEEVLKATRSSEKLTRSKDLSDSNESTSHGDNYSFYKSNAGNIADHIINSINSKPKLSPFHSKYDDKFLEKQLYKPIDDGFCSTKTTPSRSFTTRKIDDVEIFKYPDLSTDSAYSRVGKEEGEFRPEDKEKFKKPEVRFKDIDYKMGNISPKFTKTDNKNYDVKDYLEKELPKRENSVEKVSAEDEESATEIVENKIVVEEDIYDDKEMYTSKQCKEPENIDEYLDRSNEETSNIDKNVKESNSVEVEYLPSEPKQELYIPDIEEKHKIEDEKEICDEPKENEDILRDTTTENNEFEKYNTPYEANITEDNQYNEHQQLPQYEQPIQNAENIQQNENLTYEEDQPHYQEYEENAQPLSLYNEVDKSNAEYEENKQSQMQSNIKPEVQYNTDQSDIQYNNEQVERIQSDDKTPDSQSKPSNEKSEHPDQVQEQDVQPRKENDEQKEPIPQYEENRNYEREQPMQYDNDGRPVMPYDDGGQSLMQYDENGQPVIQYNETGQPIMQYDENGQPIVQYDENGQPIMMQYDENGQPIMQYDANGQPILMQYNENGQPLMMQYDEQGQPIMQYDQNGQPIMMQYDQNGQPIQFDEHGQPMMYDDNGQAMLQYDEHGQPIYPYGQTEGYYQDNQMYDDNVQQEQHYEEPKDVVENVTDQKASAKNVTEVKEVTKNVTDVKEVNENVTEVKETKKNVDIKEAVKEKVAEKKPTVMEMLDTDTESVKQDTKVSNDSDFDFSNS